MLFITNESLVFGADGRPEGYGIGDAASGG